MAESHQKKTVLGIIVKYVERGSMERKEVRTRRTVERSWSSFAKSMEDKSDVSLWDSATNVWCVSSIVHCPLKAKTDMKIRKKSAMEQEQLIQRQCRALRCCFQGKTITLDGGSYSLSTTAA